MILYNYINHHAGTPSKTKTEDTMSLGYSSICYIGSSIGWVSVLILYYHIISHQTSYRSTRQEIRSCFMIVIR